MSNEIPQGATYNVPLTNEDIGKLSEALDIVVKHVGLQHPYMVEYSLGLLSKCRKAIEEHQKKEQKKEEKKSK